MIEWLERTDDQYPSLMNGSDLVCASLEAVDPFSAIFEDGIVPIRIFLAKPGEGELSRVVMVTLAHYDRDG